MRLGLFLFQCFTNGSPAGWEKAEAESVDEVNKKSEERAARDVRYFSFAAHSRPTICLFYFLYLF